jgi:glycosyltransferase involved in cell wall biosynthesis
LCVCLSIYFSAIYNYAFERDVLGGVRINVCQSSCWKKSGEKYGNPTVRRSKYLDEVLANKNGVRMRVGIDFHTWDGIYQGSRSHILGIYRAAIVLAPDIDFIFFVCGNVKELSVIPEFGLGNVKIIEISKGSGVIRLLFLYPWLAIKHRCNVFHTQYRIPPVLFRRSVVTIHDILIESHPQFFGKGFVAISKLSFRFSAHLAKLCCTVSEYSKTEISRIYGIEPDRIVVTSNAIDKLRFTPDKDSQDEGVLSKYGLNSQEYLLTVGRLEPRKNHINLIRAWRRIEGARLPLIIVGQKDFSFGEIFEECKDDIESGQIRFLENVDDGELPTIYRHTRLFAYVPFAEGFGMPALEAMACGCPIVTSNTTSLPEVCAKAAIYCDPSNVEDIFLGITKLIGDRECSDRLKYTSVERARYYSWDKSARNLINALRENF